jgi:drug/metabolite transporter (DMT)-like permease
LAKELAGSNSPAGTRLEDRPGARPLREQATDLETAADQARPSPARRPYMVVLALLAIYVIWGSTYLGIRFALEGFPPFLMAGLRFILAGAGMYVFLRGRGAPAPSRTEWRGAALAGCLLLVGGNGGVTFAQQWVSSGLAALVVATVPLWAALFSGLFGRWPRRLEWAGLALGFGGIVLLNLESDLRANLLGTVVLFLAPVCWAFGSVWSRHLPLPSGLMSAAAQMVVGSIVLLAAGLALGERIDTVPGERPLLALAYLVVFGSIIAFSAYVFLLGRVRPALATSYAYVNPIVAVGLGVGLAGERITGSGVLAMLAILAGVVLVAWKRG